MKEDKLSKELDSLVHEKYHGNGNATKKKPFRRQPGRGRAPVPRLSTTTGAAGSRTVKGKPETSSRAKGAKTNRYHAKSSSHLRNKLIRKGQNLERCNRSLASSRLKIDFLTITEPPKFAGHFAKFLPNWSRVTRDQEILDMVVGYKLELTAPPRPTQGQSTFALFVNGVQENRGRNFEALAKGGLDKCNPRFRPV